MQEAFQYDKANHRVTWFAVGKAGFEELTVGKGGAGMLWDMHFSEQETIRTSLLRPPKYEEEDDDSSDTQSIVSMEDVAKPRSDVLEPIESVPEVRSLSIKDLSGPEVKVPAHQFSTDPGDAWWTKHLSIVEFRNSSTDATTIQSRYRPLLSSQS